MAELTPEEIRGLLDGSTLGPWIAVARSGQTLDEGERSGLGFDIEGPPEPMLRGQFANGPDARLIAAAPDLARQLLAAMEENEPLRSGDYCEHGIDCPGTGPDCARAGTLDEARQRAWTSAVLIGNEVHKEQSTTIATLEGIVRRLLDGWIASRTDPGMWWWRNGDGYEPMAPAEALILKEMQQ